MVQFSVAFGSSQKKKKTKEWGGATKASRNTPCPVAPSVGDASVCVHPGSITELLLMCPSLRRLKEGCSLK